MASKNKVPFLESAGVEGSPLEKETRCIGSMVVDLVNRSGQIGEDRANAHSNPIIAELRTRLRVANGRVAHLEARLNASEAGAARVRADANTHIAQYTSSLEARNMQMVNTVAETVEMMKRDAAARVAAAETHAQGRIDEYRDKTNSQIRQLSRDLERHIDMLGLARKHTGWVAHKLLLLEDELKKRTRLPDKTALVHCLNNMFEELADYRNTCDDFLDNGLADFDEPDWGPVPDDEGGALLNGFYGKSSRVTSANNTEERSNQPQAPVSPSGKDTPNEQASREQSSLFVDDQQSGRSDQSCTIKSEDRDNNRQLSPIRLNPPSEPATLEARLDVVASVREQSSGGNYLTRHTQYPYGNVDGLLVWEIVSLDV